MVISKRGGIDGKVCSGCKSWKPLSDFPNDQTHGPSQGGKHCRCKKCHSEYQKKTRQSGILALAFLLSFARTAKAQSPANDLSTGEKLVSVCKVLDYPTESMTTENILDGALCQGFLLGYRQTMASYGNPEGLCIPPGVTLNQIRKIFMKYTSDHPESLHKGSSILLSESIKGAFSCSSVK